MNFTTFFLQSFETRFYRVHAAGPSIHLEPVAISPYSLDPRFVFILDKGKCDVLFR